MKYRYLLVACHALVGSSLFCESSALAGDRVTVVLEGRAMITDDETLGGDEVETMRLNHRLSVSPTDLMDSHKEWWCVGDEVLVTLYITATYKNPRRVDVTFDAKLYESDKCNTSDKEDEASAIYQLKRGASTTSWRKTLKNRGFGGGDTAELDIAARALF